MDELDSTLLRAFPSLGFRKNRFCDTWSGHQPAEASAPTTSLLVAFLLAGSLFRLLFGLLPSGIGVVFLHAFG
jgi:hypothetical protein